MNIVDSYLSKIDEILEKIRKEERDNLAIGENYINKMFLFF